MSTVVLRTQTLGDLAVADGYLLLAARGNWQGCVECSTAKPTDVLPAGEPIALLVYPEARPSTTPMPSAFTGTVRRAKTDPGKERLVASFVGGAGGLLEDLGPADHVGGATLVPAGAVAARIVSGAGEQLAAGVEQALDAYDLARWHRAGGITAADALDLFVAELAEQEGLDIGWRMQRDGKVWIGVETWPAGSSAATYADQDPDDGVLVYTPSGAELLPGTTIQEDLAVEVLYGFGLAKLRAEVRHAVAGDPPHKVDRSLYTQTYDATVKKQRGDGTLDLTCEDDRIGDVLAVPFRVGIPGCKVTIPQGANVRLGWASASPRSPFAFAPDQDPAANKALALVGDSIVYLSATVAAAPGPVTFIASPIATGAPGEVHLSIAGPGHKYAKGVSGP